MTNLISQNLIANNQIHLWYLAKDAMNELYLYTEGISLLTRDEWQRYKLINHSRRAKQFLLGRILLRRCLSDYLQLEANAVEFIYNSNGKPELPIAIAGDLVFSLSHTHSDTVVAIARGKGIGVDVEILSRTSSALNILKNMFSKETKIPFNFSELLTPQEAIVLWSLKESVVKAIGSTVWEGLSAVQLNLYQKYIEWSRPPPEGNEANWFLMSGNYSNESILTLALQKKQPICEEQEICGYVLCADGIDKMSFKVLRSSCSAVTI